MYCACFPVYGQIDTLGDDDDTRKWEWHSAGVSMSWDDDDFIKDPGMKYFKETSTLGPVIVSHGHKDLKEYYDLENINEYKSSVKSVGIQPRGLTVMSTWKRSEKNDVLLRVGIGMREHLIQLRGTRVYELTPDTLAYNDISYLERFSSVMMRVAYLKRTKGVWGDNVRFYGGLKGDVYGTYNNLQELIETAWQLDTSIAKVDVNGTVVLTNPPDDYEQRSETSVGSKVKIGVGVNGLLGVELAFRKRIKGRYQHFGLYGETGYGIVMVGVIGGSVYFKTNQFGMAGVRYYFN